MDLILGRRAGSAPPDPHALRAALLRQGWLTHRPDDPLKAGGTFAFPGGGLYVVVDPVGEDDYVAPWIYVWLAARHDFRAVAPRLVRLAAELGLGVDTTCPSGRWWGPPAPSALAPGFLERAVATSAAAEGAEAWLLLGFVLAGPACLELAESNPALALLAAGMNWFRTRPATTIPRRHAFLRELASRPRHEILARTGGRGTRSMVRVLGRVVPERLDLDALRQMTREGLPPQAEKALRHLSRFRCGLVRLAADPRLWPHVGPQLLREAAEEEDEHAIPALLRDTLDIAGRLGARGRVQVLSSRARLVALHDAFVAEWNRRPPEERRADDDRAGGPRAARWPALLPPAGTAAITPLTTIEDLWREGAEMRHCVGSYDRRVSRGECLVYRVTAPERATLSIRHLPAQGIWTIEQLAGPGNRPVTAETRASVQRWLEGEDGLPQPRSGGSRAGRHSRSKGRRAA